MTEMIATPPVSPTNGFTNKRVSFGETPVKTTFLYDREDTTPATPPKKPFTDSDAPVAKVKVTSQETQEAPEPWPIAPPIPIDPTATTKRVQIESPLPFLKRMEHEHENPFRPEESLYHEVDPIVDAYLHKPFPPSVTSSPNGTPVRQNGNQTTSPQYLQNGLSKEQLMQNEKSEQHQPLLTKESSPVKRQSKGHGDDGLDEMPQAGQVELVHIKKKKCGCCSLQ